MPQVHPRLHNSGVFLHIYFNWDTFPSQLFILPSISLSCHQQLPAAILNTTSHTPRRPLCWNAPFTRCVRYASHLFAVRRQVFRDLSVFSDAPHEITALPIQFNGWAVCLTSSTKAASKATKKLLLFFCSLLLWQTNVRNSSEEQFPHFLATVQLYGVWLEPDKAPISRLVSSYLGIR